MIHQNGEYETHPIESRSYQTGMDINGEIMQREVVKLPAVFRYRQFVCGTDFLTQHERPKVILKIQNGALVYYVTQRNVIAQVYNGSASLLFRNSDSEMIPVSTSEIDDLYGIEHEE